MNAYLPRFSFYLREKALGVCGKCMLTDFLIFNIDLFIVLGV